MNKLTERQRRFVLAFIETGNASEAARRAGYSSKTAERMGQENMQKPVIIKAIRAKMQELETKKIANVQEILQFLTATLRGEVKEQQVVIEAQQNGTSQARMIDVEISMRERLKAADMLLKRFPRKLDEQEQQIRIKKLENEVKRISNEDQQSDSVQIIDDIGDFEDETS